MKLLIVESPTKAKTLSRFLGKDYKVLASKGHIRDLPKSRLGIDIKNNFEPEYINIRGKGEMIKQLKNEAKKADEVLLATDPDREGEAISYHLGYVLGLDEKSKNRIEFHEITKESVKKSIENKRSVDMNLVNAQQARRLLDRIVGYEISPILWKKIRSGLSAGRVQSVATKIIVDREREIDNFKPVEYWVIKADLKYKESIFKTELAGYKDLKNIKSLKISTKEEADNIVKAVKSKNVFCESIKKSKNQRRPAPPFTTSTMQQEASKYLRFSASKTMMTAQELYEGINIKSKGVTGLITYMRTDSTRLSDYATDAAKKFIIDNYGEKYHKKNNYTVKKKNNTQDAHEAIRPTDINIRPDDIKVSLNNEQYKLYKLIYNRFLMSQMSNAQFDSITIDFNGSDYIFRASYKELKFPGYMVIQEDQDEKDLINLNGMKEKDTVQLKKINSEQKFTKPPSRFTEAALIKLLEDLEIGRPSTYAPTISTILNRDYVEIKDKVFFPTKLGYAVTEFMEKNFKDIVDTGFTRDLESELDMISEGKINWHKVLSEFYKDFDKDLENALNNAEENKIEDELTDIICDKCGARMAIKKSRYGKFLGCSRFPECKNTMPLLERTEARCPDCGSFIIKKKSKTGRIFYGCESYPKCNFASFDEIYKDKCPKCGSYMTIKRKTKEDLIKCSNCEYSFTEKKENK